MASNAQDVMRSLGFLALQAEQQDLQRQQTEAFQAKQAEDARSAQGFDRMTQLLSTLDQRRQASHDRDMEIAKLAGSTGVDVNPEQDDDVKGMARIGKGLQAAKDRQLAAEQASKEAIQRLISERWGARNDQRQQQAQLNADVKLAGINQKPALEDQKLKNAKELDDYKTGNRIKVKGATPGKAASATGAPGEGRTPLTTPMRTTVQKKVAQLGEAYNQFRSVKDSFTEKDYQELGLAKNVLSRKWNGFLERIGMGSMLSEDEINTMAEGSAATAKLIRFFNVLGKERSGAAFTNPEVKRLMMELPNVSDNPTAMKAKLDAILSALQTDINYWADIDKNGGLPDTEKRFAADNRKDAMKDPAKAAKLVEAAKALLQQQQAK